MREAVGFTGPNAADVAVRSPEHSVVLMREIVPSALVLLVWIRWQVGAIVVLIVGALVLRFLVSSALARDRATMAATQQTTTRRDMLLMAIGFGFGFGCA